MILRLTDVSSEPLHLQIRRQIRALILGGELGEGDGLPSIRGLARQERVSVITVQRAYDDLERDSLIKARAGKGFFVTAISPTRKVDMAQERLGSSLETAIATASAEGLSAQQITAVFEDRLRDSSIQQRHDRSSAGASAKEEAK